MVNIEEKNTGIAKVLSSIFDEESRHFFVQKSAKFKRIGYISSCNEGISFGGITGLLG